MKSLSTWIIALSALSFVACDSTDDPVEAGTEVAGGAEGGVMTGGVMTGGAMTGGAMTGGAMTGGAMTGGAMTGGAMTGGAMTGGMMTGGVDVPGGTMTGPGCTEPLEVGVSCDVFNDCCARGTQCTSLAADGSDPVCLRRCDANAEITGCEARELCNPESGDVPADQESPGTCIPGDDCEPGNENLACGEGEFYCQRAQNITLCIGDLAEVRAQAPELIVGAGADCNPFDDMAPTFCEQGLVCEYGVCRDLCDTDADCGEGSECVDYTSRVDGIPYKFCLDSCDIYAQDCPTEGDVCILGDSYDGAVIGLCEGAAGPNGTGVSGDECTTSETTYWGSCDASNLCTQLSEDGPAECVSFCDDYHLDVCGDYQACAFLLALDDVGICLGECNIFTQEGCAEGQECQLFNEGVNANDEPVAFGSCVENSVPAAERVMTGDACTGEAIEVDGMMLENPFVSNCPANHYCGDTTGDGVSTCVAACDPTNVADTGCPEGISCRVVFDGIEAFGLCL